MIHIFYFQNDLLIKEIMNVIVSFPPCLLKCQKQVRICGTNAIFSDSGTSDTLKRDR